MFTKLRYQLCWHLFGKFELHQKVYFLSLQLCVPLSNSSLHLWFCKETRSDKSKKLFLITHQTEHKQSNHCLPEDQWFSEISWTLSMLCQNYFVTFLKNWVSRNKIMFIISPTCHFHWTVCWTNCGCWFWRPVREQHCWRWIHSFWARAFARLVFPIPGWLCSHTNFQKQ